MIITNPKSKYYKTQRNITKPKIQKKEDFFVVFELWISFVVFVVLVYIWISTDGGVVLVVFGFLFNEFYIITKIERKT